MSYIKLIIFSFFFFLSFQINAQETCIQLENISIGCVPSQSHVCFRNVNVSLSGGNGSCKYTKIEMTGQHYKAPKGAIAFECSSPPVIETICVRDGDRNVCTTTSTCKEYSKPVCQEICELCHKEVIEEPKKTAGCIVCTRPRCDKHEPTPSAKCPIQHSKQPEYFLPDTNRPVCGAVPTCQAKATDPNGVTHDVTINRSNCPANEMVKKAELAPGDPINCPWINDPHPCYMKGTECVEINADSTGAQVAEACGRAFPIQAPNRYPEDYNP
ncbi:MAG: hypothetical protein ABL930_10135 [Pseudobdellovibrio sp.]